MTSEPASFRKQMIAAMTERGWTVAELHRRTGVSYDAITKLKRREGASTSAENAAAIADALGLKISADLPPNSLPTYKQPKIAGLEESAAAYVFREQPAEANDPQGGLRRIFGNQARSPATIQAAKHYPGFNISRGDVLVLDLSRLPNPGEICEVRIEDENGAVYSDFRRYLPPHLIDGTTGFNANTLSVDDPRITIRNPVIGLMRGLPKQNNEA